VGKLGNTLETRESTWVMMGNNWEMLESNLEMLENNWVKLGNI